MTVFAAIAPTADPRLDAAIKDKFAAGNYYLLAPGQYLVYAPNFTTQKISDLLEAPLDKVGRVMILRVTDYAGWHSRDMWEWVSSHITQSVISAPLPPTSEKSSG
jgi:hypothetical protein